MGVQRHETAQRRENEEAVSLRVYDISGGAARVWSPVLLGRRLEGVWHTGIEVHGYEYFYGGGIVKMRPDDVEATYNMHPIRVHHLGFTEYRRTDFERYLFSIMPMFRRDSYDLVKWNCNNFSDHVAKYLVGTGIPSYILELPEEVQSTFMGKIILNFAKMMAGGEAAVGATADSSQLLPREILEKREIEFVRRDHQRRNSCPASPTNIERSGGLLIEAEIPPRNFHVRFDNSVKTNDGVGRRRKKRSATVASSRLPDDVSRFSPLDPAIDRSRSLDFSSVPTREGRDPIYRVKFVRPAAGDESRPRSSSIGSTPATRGGNRRLRERRQSLEPSSPCQR